MARNHHLRERRERLGLSQHGLVTAARQRFMHQGTVSAAELRPEVNPGAVEHVRRALIKLELQKRAERYIAARRSAWLVSERQRIIDQERIFAALPDCPETAALKTAMLERCLDLMHEGFGEQCDAIAEWLPRADVDRMFARWEAEVSADRKCGPCEPATIMLKEGRQ